MTLPAVLASAAIGAIVAALIGLAGQWFERRARRKELLMQTAVQLALSRERTVVDLWKANGGKLTLHDPGSTFVEYYKTLQHVFDHDELPPAVRGAVESQKKSGGAPNERIERTS